MQKKSENWWSIAGVVGLALALPIFLRGINYLQRLWVGAEGRLAAISVSTERELGPMPAPWKAMAQGGFEVKNFLDGNEEKIKSLGPEQIRIDHIYDQFGVVTRREGKLEFDWSNLDRTVDGILAVGAQPFLVLSYMPEAIAKEPPSGEDKTLQGPVNWDEWANVVQRTIEHYSGEKGLGNVYYEVWNEPDLFGKWRMGGRKDYRLLYAYSARGAAAARGVRPFKLGGPATTGLYKNWTDQFLEYVLKNRLRLDFYSWHRYERGVEKYTADISNIDGWLDRHPYFSQVEKIISETALSSEKNGGNNSKVGAVQLIATARELLYKVRYGFNFSVVGESFGILGTPRENALKMLSQLGQARLPVDGEGTWVRAIAAKNRDGVQVVIVNYDPKGEHSEVVPVTFLGLTPGKYVIREMYLGGVVTTREMATDAAMWQKEIPMTPNSAVLLELEPKL
ncbi:hypothetical protein A2634_00750 [Candidatus Amesbacteria bacterium RIFCSPHIGHO2_01_FULL_48_32]|uniref:Glycosyl hydrolases family 39 N-terminal catalytic domain-containing protein n=1 Tax=Candidatus Amesbacteria bacterium RIFCSPLOWO2_01_FULL_48_25 TaxID=1797259 RepID=A0A1F4ZAW1_9BACT|nr:MAG: hypothetical protein A2634_00750 [Candidatus Amesbacteria bacterium RIFCSPHIGHO2_01_FULL_48_32]OGD03335.1 MAG: hypothetical protein A2989_00700 [Candidatus Amesbacteria bacterium RIFCSPLOWO2_01_FULL_48_25]HJZ05287.1 hypothetical protein [Patescibacteria group bacterium]